MKDCPKVSGKTKEGKEKKQIPLPLLKTLNKMSRNKMKIKRTTATCQKSKRKSEEGCFLCFYRQPWTSDDRVEVSWVKQIKTIKTDVKIYLYNYNSLFEAFKVT